MLVGDEFTRNLPKESYLNQLKKCASDECSTLIDPGQALCSRCEMRMRGTAKAPPAKARSSFRPPKKRR